MTLYIDMMQIRTCTIAAKHKAVHVYVPYVHIHLHLYVLTHTMYVKFRVHLHTSVPARKLKLFSTLSVSTSIGTLLI